MARHTQRVKNIMWCPPVDTNGTPQGGNRSFISMKNANRAVIKILVGNLAGDIAVTLKQAKNVEGGGSKALAYSKILVCKSTASPPEHGDLWHEEAVTSNSYTLANATHDNYMFIIEIKGDDLDVNNGFDCIRPQFADPAAAAVIAVLVELHDLRLRGDEENINVLPSALKN
jgi:hypothetical protein